MNKIEFGFFLERVPIFLLAPTAYFLATGRPAFALAVFFVGVIGWVLLRFAVHDPRKLNVAALEV